MLRHFELYYIYICPTGPRYHALRVHRAAILGDGLFDAAGHAFATLQERPGMARRCIVAQLLARVPRGAWWEFMVVTLTWDITERPRAPNGVAAFMSAHSKTPHITSSMDFSSGKRGSTGSQGEAA